MLIVQIDVAVNAPEAGTITQWFVSEEDNVEVGQKLCEIDTEGKASRSMCSPSLLTRLCADQISLLEDEEPLETKPDPKGVKEAQEAKRQEKHETSEEPKQSELPKKKREESISVEGKPVPPPKESSVKPPSPTTPAPPSGNREERRASHVSLDNLILCRSK